MRECGASYGAPSPRNATEFADLFEHAELAVQRRAWHVPWLDDPERFTRALAAFLG